MVEQSQSRQEILLSYYVLGGGEGEGGRLV